MPAKKHVAAEIVAARPHRGERRQQPCLQFDKAADRRRRPLLHRQPRAFELGCAARALHGHDAQHKAIGALADVAGFDKARQRHRKHRPRQHAMGDPRRLPGRDRKARRDGSNHHRDRKELLPPQQHRRRAKHDRQSSDHGQNRFMIGRKVKRNSGPERHRHPGQQPAGAGFRTRPRAQRFDQRRPERGSRRRKPADRRCGARRPGAGIAPLPARHVALLRHVTTPCDLLSVTRLPDVAHGPKPEGMQKPEEMHVG